MKYLIGFVAGVLALGMLVMWRLYEDPQVMAL